MKRLAALINLILLISIQWTLAQPDNLKMSDLREINFQVVKLIEDYETYSAFSIPEDYSGFKNLFTSADALVYCDVLSDDKLDEMVGPDEYMDIIKLNYSEVNTVIKVNKINLPSFSGKTGFVDAEISKASSGLNKCKANFKESFDLVVTVRFQVIDGRFENYKISGVRSIIQKGKPIGLVALSPGGKVLPGESFIINNKTFTTDNHGYIKYNLFKQDSSLLIIPQNNKYTGKIISADFKDLLAHSKAGFSPCDPKLVEFTVGKAAELADKTDKAKKETKKEKLIRENYEKSMAEALILLTGKKYPEAKAAYQSALKFKPGDAYAQQKIADINISLNEIKVRDESYTKAVAEGDALYNADKYHEALEPYRRANSIKPEEKYPLAQIEKINGLFAQVKKTEGNYASLVAEADKLLKDKKYSEAKISYQSVLKFKPGDTYAQQKINEINISLNEIKVRDESYTKAIAEGDALYNADKYHEALEPYRRANAIKPEEKYPLAQIEKINGLFAQVKKTEGNYASLVAEADKLLKDKKYSEAKLSYQSVLKFKPGDTYAQQKINEINISLNEIKVRDESYTKSVAEGDALYNADKYHEALEPYRRANAIKPEEKYPLAQIEKINGLFAQVKKTEGNYASLVAEADKFLKDKKYSEAKLSYQSALKFMPGDTYAQQKINEINTSLNEIKVRDESYTNAISEGDNYFNAGKFPEASASYKQAGTLNPLEKYPLEQIEKINGILARLKKKDENYAIQITKADKFLADKKYNDAIASYTQALSIKPAEKYPKDRISIIKSIMAGTTEINKQYASAVSDGNAAFADKDYEKAIASYKTALQFKPQALLPKEKIAQAETEIKRLNDSYASAIAEGDNRFQANQLQSALESYNKALSSKSGEKYPTDKIKEINGILEQNKITRQQYDRELAEGDVSFYGRNFEKALSHYKTALKLIPEEQQAKDKIALAEDEIRKLSNSYRTMLAEGDKKYSSKKYHDAIDAYQNALDIFPAEKYPRDQILLIKAILSGEKTTEFPIGIVLNYILPSASGPIVNKTELIKNKITSSQSLGYGIVAGWKFKSGRLGKFQVSTGLTIDNIEFHSEFAQQYSQDNNALDQEGYTYTRKILLNNLSETIKLSYFTIPLCLEKIFTLGKSGWALSVNASANLMLLSSASNESRADISYSGYYPDLFNLTITELPYYKFGNYQVITSNKIKAKPMLMSMDFGVGLNKRIGRISMFAKVRHRTSNNDLFETKDLWSLSQDFKQIESTMNFKNQFKLRYNYLTIGLVFNL